jgi:hypothetical protein
MGFTDVRLDLWHTYHYCYLSGKSDFDPSKSPNTHQGVPHPNRGAAAIKRRRIFDFSG